ncbi:MAG: MATE family efflux transporter [Acidobacteria bacterium]|nr:MATE family efflux transporter [Acidobacteriota bacterium]
MDANDAGGRPFLAAPHRTLLTLALPVLGSLIAEPLTGLVDTAFVARLGAEPLAALGVGATMLSAAFWAFSFLGVATQTEVGTLLGRGDEAHAAQVNALALTLAALLGLALTLSAWPGVPMAVGLLGAEGSVAELGVSYARLRLLGAPAVLLTFAAFGALRGLQDMRTPLWIAAAVNILNVLLDYPLVFGLGPVPALGVAGAALASSLSQWIGAVWASLAALRRLGRPDALDWSRAPAIFTVGRDLFLRAATLNLFLLVGTRTANNIGAEAGAVHQVIRSAWMFAALFLDSFALSGQSLTAYFVGSGRLDAARRVAQVVCQWSAGTGALLGLGMLVTERWMLEIFVPPEAAFLFAVPWRISALSQPINGLSFGTDGIHWGTGDFRYLRNAVIVATAVGITGLLLVDESAPGALSLVWLAAVAWVSVRALLGVLRVWPGILDAPLRRR